MKAGPSFFLPKRIRSGNSDDASCTTYDSSVSSSTAIQGHASFPTHIREPARPNGPSWFRRFLMNHGRVTRGEFQTRMDAMETQMNEMKQEMKTKMETMETKMEKGFEEIRKALGLNAHGAVSQQELQPTNAGVHPLGVADTVGTDNEPFTLPDAEVEHSGVDLGTLAVQNTGHDNAGVHPMGVADMVDPGNEGFTGVPGTEVKNGKDDSSNDAVKGESSSDGVKSVGDVEAFKNGVNDSTIDPIKRGGINSSVDPFNNGADDVSGDVLVDSSNQAVFAESETELTSTGHEPSYNWHPSSVVPEEVNRSRVPEEVNVGHNTNTDGLSSELSESKKSESE